MVQLVQSVSDGEPSSCIDAFYNPTDGYVSVVQMLENISKFIAEDPASYYTLIIGTDSQAKHINGIAEIDFVSAIIIYRRRRGARYFFRKEKRQKKPILRDGGHLRDKIYTETLMSLELAKTLVPQIQKQISPDKYDLEIHIDVGNVGPTREMIREVVGMVTGSGYVAKTKPDSWGASSVADKHT